jgi:hypothetical protein
MFLPFHPTPPLSFRGTRCFRAFARITAAAADKNGRCHRHCQQKRCQFLSFHSFVLPHDFLVILQFYYMDENLQPDKLYK